MTNLENSRFTTDETDFPIILKTNGSEFQIIATESGAVRILCTKNGQNILVKPRTGNSVEIIAQ